MEQSEIVKVVYVAADCYNGCPGYCYYGVQPVPGRFREPNCTEPYSVDQATFIKDAEKVVRFINDHKPGRTFFGVLPEIQAVDGWPDMFQNRPDIIDKIVFTNHYITNAGRFSKGYIGVEELQKAGINGITVTLNGNEKNHEAVTSRPGSYQGIFDMIRDIKPTDMEIKLVMRVDRNTAYDVLEVVPQFKDDVLSGRIRLEIGAWDTVGNALCTDNKLVTIKDAYDVQKGLEEILGVWPLSLDNVTVFWSSASEWYKPESTRIKRLGDSNSTEFKNFEKYCQSKRLEIGILPNGDVVHFGYLMLPTWARAAFPELKFGNVREVELLDDILVSYPDNVAEKIKAINIARKEEIRRYMLDTLPEDGIRLYDFELLNQHWLVTWPLLQYKKSGSLDDPFPFRPESAIQEKILVRELILKKQQQDNS